MAEIKAPAESERIVLIGNGLGERMVDHPYFETGLQLGFPKENLYFRNLCHPGDTPGFRPHPSRKSQWAFPGAEKFHPQHKIHAGQGFYPTPDEWLTDLKPDTLIAFFGYNESFDGPSGLNNFKGELDAFIKHTLSQKYNGKAAPRFVLVSPIAYEDLSNTRDLPDGRAENANLALYTQAMGEIAAANKVEFVNLYDKTHKLYSTIKAPFTRNGFLPNDDGYKWLALNLQDEIFGKGSSAALSKREAVLTAVKDKNWFWFNDYRMLNGVHVDGRRYKPFGPANYPAEKTKNREMTEIRDQAIWAEVSGNTFDLVSADKETHPLPEVKTNYASSKKNGSTDYKYGEDAVKDLTTPEGYKVELFASEKDFPNLANPMQVSFDNKGRLWVATMPTYPHYRPGDPLPDDKLLIYEDTDGDGKADKETVFADGLHLPIGFEFAPGGVYVSQEPHLIFLADKDGDDKADSKEVVLTGFDSHDTHHAISAYAADPSGAFMLCEGVFLHSNVETPYGPVRGVDGGFYRFSPQKTKLERTSQLRIPNPWGFAFDEWGQDFFIYTSGPQWEWHLPGSLKVPYGEKNPRSVNLVPKGQSVRPTSGLEFVSSRHFPDEVQGDALIGNCIGFLGVKQHSIVDDGTGYKTAFRQDLLKSSDGNFRPGDLEFAPDGSLYIIDWHNVLIGHMQHNARDPLRDHMHGRIYRITYPSRPLVKPADVAGASVETLLENLKLPEYRSRYRSRRELRGHSADTVIPAVQKWIAALDKSDPRYSHHILEGLWVTWGMNKVDTDLVKKLLKSDDFHVRAAAVRVIRYNFDLFPDAIDLLKLAADDEHGRVRLEAVVASTWYDKSGAIAVVETANAKGTDKWDKDAINTALGRLKGEAEIEVIENPMPPVPEYLSKEEKSQFTAGHEIYFRDAHCSTCHQPDGKGLDPAFPPLEDSIFVHGDADRLIKITLHGLMGPFEMNGKKYNGQVPMTPFGGMLNDKEVASVLTYVRNRFGNKASAITSEQVKKVRDETKAQSGFNQMDVLLKEHPLEK
jgi:mono/diheme cytochrome c family protein/glucose/arabinose dehydrogenase|tara:strand:+ start:7242 stop:10328 length:3087 start_codon:yes stop_codon:yes gene_type:complete